MKVLYCGFGRPGLECLYQLMSCFNVKTKNILVFTHESNENIEFVEHLTNNRITYFVNSINDHVEEITKFHPDYLLSVYYRRIIKPKILEIVKYKAMNLHPSLLPAYRGTKSSVWALLNNEKQTGISFHYINDKIDDGNIILQKEIEITNEDTAYSLYHKLISVFSKNFDIAFQLLIESYKGYQQKGMVSYYSRDLPYGGIRRFDEITYQQAENFVKAMYFPPYKGAMFEKKNREKVEILHIEDLIEYKDIIGRNL